MQNTRVRKLFSTILGVGAMAGSLVLTSCEDEFTEADAIKAQQETLAALKDQDAKNEMEATAMQDSLNRIGARINYTVTVTTAGEGSTTNGRTAANASAEGATVTLTQAGKTYTETAGKGGVATFTGLLNGQATVTVEAEDHTTVTYTTNLGTNGNDKTDNNVGTLIPVFPMTVEAGATMVSGKAWAELDATNDAPEPAVGATVRATINVSTALNPYRNFNDYGRIETATYEGFSQEVKVDSEGNYSLIMPTGNGSSGQGFAPAVTFMPFTAKQKFVEMEDGKLVVSEKDVLFGDGDSDDDGDHITDFPGVYVEIEAPTGKAEGFEAKAELVKQNLYDDDLNWTGGTGYAVDDVFELSADGDIVPTITVTSVDEETGEIIGISYNSNGAMYAEKPSIAPKTVTGSGAEFMFDFINKYKVVVANPGSGYWTAPELGMTYTHPNGSPMIASPYYSLNVEDGQVEEKDQEVELRSQRVNGDGASYITEFYSTTEPLIVTRNPEAKQAMIDPRLIYVEDGKIMGIDMDMEMVRVSGPVFPWDSEESMFEGGNGYETAPKVTFKTAAGEGTGAEGIALIEDGEVVAILVTEQGSGYEEVNVIEHEENSYDQQSFDDDEIVPGASNTNINFSYGAGDIQ